MLAFLCGETMISLLYKVAKMATDLDADGNFSKANRLDRLLEITAGGMNWKDERSYDPDTDEHGIKPGQLHEQELEGPNSNEPNLNEEMEEAGLNIRQPRDVGLAKTPDTAFSSILLHFKGRFKSWLSNQAKPYFGHPNAESRLMANLEQIFDELASKGNGKAEWDPEFPVVARKLISEVLKEIVH